MSQGFAIPGYPSSLILTALQITGLTASLPIITDAGKNLVSLAYTGATSFRKNLGLEQSDTPTFAGLIVPGISPAANFVLTQNAVAVMTFVGASAVVNTLYLKEGKVGIGTTSPAFEVDIRKSTSLDIVLALGNAVDANVTQLGKQGSSAYGAIGAGDAFLYSVSPISIMSNAVGGIIKFSTGGNTARVTINSNGIVTFSSLAGTGTRNVVVNANGDMSAP